MENNDAQLLIRIRSLEKRITFFFVFVSILFVLLLAISTMAFFPRILSSSKPESIGTISPNEMFFYDAMGEVTLTNGAVRMDLVRLNSENDGEQTLKSVSKVVMPPNGFLRSFSTMKNLVDQLKNADMISSDEEGRLLFEPGRTSSE